MCALLFLKVAIKFVKKRLCNSEVAKLLIYST